MQDWWQFPTVLQNLLVKREDVATFAESLSLLGRGVSSLLEDVAVNNCDQIEGRMLVAHIRKCAALGQEFRSKKEWFVQLENHFKTNVVFSSAELRLLKADIWRVALGR